jgi:lysozyme
MQYPKRVISKNEKDRKIVKAIQTQLNDLGFGLLTVDGDFGNKTAEAVKRFQATQKDAQGNPLVKDGKVGAITWALLFDFVHSTNNTSKIAAVSDECLKLIQYYEGCKLIAYQDSVKIWTIGIGTTVYPNGRKVNQGDRITQAEAWDFLWHDLSNFMKGVDSNTTDNINQGQYDALCSFAYNVGLGNLKSSTLLQKVNANPNDSSIQKEFEKWVNAGGQKLDGLVKRRKAEAYLYFNGKYKKF